MKPSLAAPRNDRISQMLVLIKGILERHFPRFHVLALRVWKQSSTRHLFQRRLASLKSTAAYSLGAADDDKVLIDRVIASYVKRTEKPSGQWADIYMDRHRDVHRALTTGDRPRIEEILRNPISSDLMYGFDSMAKSLRQFGMRSEDLKAPALTLDALISLAEAIGARSVENPERYGPRAKQATSSEVISQLEHKFKFEIPIPNFFPSEFGLASPRGVISYRVPQAIWQAWRVAQLVRNEVKPKVLEIGGGLGRTAFYARMFGVTDYTIVDIPISSLAQGYFLGRSLGCEAVTLQGEKSANQTNSIKLMAPSYFLEGTDRYDLVINIDSLTEMDSSDASRYWTAIESRADKLLSVNHEANEFTVSDLASKSTKVVGFSRNPSWMRRGYVEEVFEFGGVASAVSPLSRAARCC